ncbi:MAG: hypothetical protein JW915_15430 [Chitinispirillaceae bacterium]|nr:hypothetical protein [Chitinispirillaceae bacterium]
MLIKICTLWSLVLLLFINSQGQKAESGWFYTQSAGFSWNPLGVLVDGTLAKRVALYPSRKGVLWESGKMEFALRDEWTPVDNLLSFVYTLQPIAFFEITFKTGFFTQFDELGYGCFRLNSPDGKYDASTRKKTGYDDAVGYWLTVNPTLKLKFGNVVMLNSFSLNTISVNGDGYYHEVRSNLVHKTSDLDIQNDLILFYEFNKLLMAGVRYKAMTVFETDAKSHLIALGALVTPKNPKYRDIWCVLNVGVYPEEPLFKAREYAAVLFGKEFRLKKGKI